MKWQREKKKRQKLQHIAWNAAKFISHVKFCHSTVACANIHIMYRTNFNGTKNTKRNEMNSEYSHMLKTICMLDLSYVLLEFSLICATSKWDPTRCSLETWRYSVTYISHCTVAANIHKDISTKLLLHSCKYFPVYFL